MHSNTLSTTTSKFCMGKHQQFSETAVHTVQCREQGRPLGGATGAVAPGPAPRDERNRTPPRNAIANGPRGAPLHTSHRAPRQPGTALVVSTDLISVSKLCCVFLIAGESGCAAGLPDGHTALCSLLWNATVLWIVPWILSRISRRQCWGITVYSIQYHILSDSDAELSDADLPYRMSVSLSIQLVFSPTVKCFTALAF